MSNTIRKYNSLDLLQGSSQMSVTAFGAGEHGHGVQFSIGGEYAALSQRQVEDLIEVLGRRLRCEKGYSATDEEPDEIEVNP